MFPSVFPSLVFNNSTSGSIATGIGSEPIAEYVSILKRSIPPRVVAYAFNPSTKETEAGGSLWDGHQPGIVYIANSRPAGAT